MGGFTGFFVKSVISCSFQILLSSALSLFIFPLSSSYMHVQLLEKKKNPEKKWHANE
uniref:Uncharacterized protein n=1 Tax=Anguilla anguilla TaxID=7936 RepID=A0A0E9PVU8_ANGAN